MGQQQVNGDILLKKNKKELLKVWSKKKNEFLKDKENVEGIKFLEERGGHFILECGRNDATYFCSDGSFKQQRWGMYMGNHNIVNIKSISIDEKCFKLDLKELLVKQILESGKDKKIKPENSFKEMFG